MSSSRLAPRRRRWLGLALVWGLLVQAGLGFGPVRAPDSFLSYSEFCLSRVEGGAASDRSSPAGTDHRSSLDCGLCGAACPMGACAPPGQATLIDFAPVARHGGFAAVLDEGRTLASPYPSQKPRAPPFSMV